MADRPRVLIEEWLPVAELGAESQRERAVSMDLPPLFAVHVWWARRPLAASAGVILASLLPPWSAEVASISPEAVELRSREAYYGWVLRLVGILGDPVAARAAASANRSSGARATENPYGYKQAFKNSPSTSDLLLLHKVLVATWGSLPKILDPTAGGGSIPYEAVRFGLKVVANDLNPVAVASLRAGVAIPARFDSSLAESLDHWGSELVGRLRTRLETYFPAGPEEEVANYLFARTVTDPTTGRQIPLSPNWWVSRPKEVAVTLVTERHGRQLEEVEFELVVGEAAHASNPDRGTISGGNALSPWTHLAVDGAYMKEEAQAGRLGSQLYAVAVRVDGSREYRAPTAKDLDALERAEQELDRLLPEWLRAGVIPDEPVPEGSKTTEARRMGMFYWKDMFSPRQLLVHGTFVEEYRNLVPEVLEAEPDPERGRAILTELAMMVGKATNYNALLSSWIPARDSTRSVFDNHNFAFKSSFAEFEGSRELYGWALRGGVLRAYKGLSSQLRPSDLGSMNEVTLEHSVPGEVTILRGNGGDLESVPNASQTAVIIDPPYGANVMYAELADFFYVWHKRTLGMIWPQDYEDELTDKKNEAVANVGRYADAGRRRSELATADYEGKMQAIFLECHRVLEEHGVMVVMFTHKSADAWDALGMALMEAGFTIEASWPVNTEREQAFTQAKKNAAASTIMLVCRKRQDEASGDFFEDVEPLVRAEARRALEVFSAQGIGGVDLLLATYGPALSVISSRWPVYSSEADPVTGRSRLLRPEEALDAARAEVTRLQRNRLVGREASLDPISDFAMVAWDTFKAVEFPFDQARRLALAIGGLDIEELRRAKVLEKKAGTVVLLPPAKRVRRDADLEAGLPGVYPEATGFAVALDGVHTAIYIADVDGLAAAKAFIDRAGLASDPRFLATLQGLVNAIPRTKIKGEWVVPEAETLDRLSAAYFPDITLPQEPETPSFEQASLLGEE